MRKLARPLAATLLALSSVACGDPGGGGGDGGTNALAAAADNAVDAGSARMTMTMAMDVAGQEATVDGEGALDLEAKIGEVSMTVDVPGLGEQTIDMIFEEQYAYMKAPAGAPGAPSGWTRVDMSAMPGVGAGGANQFGQDPSQFLEYLRGASDQIEEVGTEEIRGVSTTHYEADLSFEKMLDAAPDQEAADELRAQLDAMGDVDSIPAEVWVDEDGLPRRMMLEMSFESGGQSMAMTFSMDLFDYGVDVDIEPPARFEELPAPAG